MGIARVDGLVLMVKDGLPGDYLRVEEIKKYRRFTQARITETLEASPDRTQPMCLHYSECGGCRLQHADYQAQLRYKSKQVLDAIQRIGHVQPSEIRPIIAADRTLAYRNKLEFSCSSRRWLTDAEITSGQAFSREAIGFHIPRFFDKIIDIQNCLLKDERSNRARNALRSVARDLGLSFYDLRTHSGFLRTLVVRSTLATTDFMLLLVVGENRPDEIDRLFKHLEPILDFVTDWIWIFNPKPNDTYTDLEPKIWKGKGFISEHVGRWQFRIGACSFFQTNPQQAQRLFEVVREAIKHPVQRIYDLYCGTGSIGIYISDLASQIIGVDYIDSAIADARINAELNGLNHLKFEAGNLGRMFDQAFIKRHGCPDVVVVDPPRAGMDPLVINQLLELLPEQIVYVSCNPATQARDLALLNEHYQVVWLQPVDLFPHTLHVETVANMRRRA